MKLLSMVTDKSPDVWAEEIGDTGSGTLKMALAEHMNTYLRPMRERRAAFAEDPDTVVRVLRAGTERARQEAAKTLAEVRAAMHMSYGL